MFASEESSPLYQYQHIGAHQSQESREKDQDFDEPLEREPASFTRRQIPLPIALLSLAICSALAFFVGIAAPARSDFPARCLQRTTQPSPVTTDVEIEFSVRHFNGSLLKENVYRQAAGPEVDAAWAALGVNCKFCQGLE